MNNIENQGKTPQQVNDNEFIAGIVLFAGIVIILIGSLYNWIIG